MNDFKKIQFEDINKLKKKKFISSLAHLIVNEPGLVGASIQGKQQTGKSVYAMLVMYEIYGGDIDKIFENLVFSMDDLKNKLRNAIEQKRKIRCLLWDDASVHGSASHWMTDPVSVQKLAQLGDTMGLATKGLLITSPSGDLIKAFRQYNFYQVKVALGRHTNDRVARGYARGTSPYGQKYFSFVFEDHYGVNLSFYQRYYTLREQLSLSALAVKHEEEVVKETVIPAKDKILEKRRDWEAGVYDDKYGYKVPWKTVVKLEGFNPGYAKNVVAMY